MAEALFFVFRKEVMSPQAAWNWWAPLRMPRFVDNRLFKFVRYGGI